jgi:hypothetical protein
MAMLTGKSCRALVAQAFPLYCFLQVLSLSPSSMSRSEYGIHRARCRSCSSSDPFHRSLFIHNLQLKTL